MLLHIPLTCFPGICFDGLHSDDVSSVCKRAQDCSGLSDFQQEYIIRAWNAPILCIGESCVCNANYLTTISKYVIVQASLRGGTAIIDIPSV